MFITHAKKTVPARSKLTLISRGGGNNRRRLHLQSRVHKLSTNQVIFSDFFTKKTNNRIPIAHASLQGCVKVLLYQLHTNMCILHVEVALLFYVAVLRHYFTLHSCSLSFTCLNLIVVRFKCILVQIQIHSCLSCDKFMFLVNLPHKFITIALIK